MIFSLDQVAREAMIEHGETQLNKYAVYIQFGISGLRELNLDVAGYPVSEELEIDSTLDTVNLPSDYIQYTRIGICGADGQIHSLGLNQRMCLPRSYDDCGNPQVGHSELVTGGFFGSLDGTADNFRNGETLGRFFGLGGGLNALGYYRIDRERGTINFSGLATGTSHIVLEYIADLKKIDGRYSVHPFAVETLKLWMYWKSIQFNSNRGLGEREMAKDNYYNARTACTRRFNTATIEEYISAFRTANMAAPRF